jgi:hypothetical protein
MSGLRFPVQAAWRSSCRAAGPLTSRHKQSARRAAEFVIGRRGPAVGGSIPTGCPAVLGLRVGNTRGRSARTTVCAGQRLRRKQPLNCSDAVQGLLLLIRLSTAEIGGLRVSYVQPCEHSSHPRVSRATAPSGPEAQQAPPGAQSTWP